MRNHPAAKSLSASLSPSPWPRRLRLAMWMALAGFALLLALSAAYVLSVMHSAPDAGDLREAGAARPSVLLSADGETLATFGRVQQRVSLEQISPALISALIATEDRRFYQHHGIDFVRTASAMLHTASGSTQGGSTITQQLARNLFPEEIGRDRSLHRKLKELVTALRIEKLYTKPQILETYLNTTPFLYGAVGVEMAARTYWGKPAAELTPLESATLVGMLKGPGYYDPVRFPERARERRNLVLTQMARQADTPDAAAAYRALSAQPLRVSLNRPADNAGSAPHFAAHVRKWLAAWAEAHDRDLEIDGLVIETPLDMRLQRAAEQAVEKQALALQQVADVEWSQAGLPGSGALESYAQRRSKAEPFAHFWKGHRELLASAVRDTPEFRKAMEGGATEAQAWQRLTGDDRWMARIKAQKTRLEAGFVAMDPATGEVKAWVGSRDFAVDQYDHVAQAERQPGSTFKPFVYGAALESGLRPDHSYIDEAVEIRSTDGSVWRPSDMSGPSGSAMTLRDGLVYSKNTVTAQVMQDVGISRVVSLARAVGVAQSKLDAVPSLALGTSPVTLLEMVNGYATIAQEGQHHAPVWVKRIRDRHGKVIAEFGEPAQRAMSANSALELIDMMRGVVAHGTGTMVKTRFGLVADVAGKTGTTQNNTDGWFILMHPQLVAGAWVGFNDSRVAMRSNYWGQGGHNAVLLVGDFFRDTLQAGLIDAQASFALPRGAAPLMAGWTANAAVSDAATGAEIMRLAVDPLANEGGEPPPTPDETERALNQLVNESPMARSTAVPSSLTSPSAPAASHDAPLLRIRTETTD